MGTLCLIDLAADILASVWPQMTSRPKPPIGQLFLGYKDLWKTIADLHQGLKGWEHLVTFRLFKRDRDLLKNLHKQILVLSSLVLN